MTAHLRCTGHAVSIGTVDRLMRDEGLSGVLRGKDHRTAIAAKHGNRAGDFWIGTSPPHALTESGSRTSPIAAPGLALFT